MTYKYFHDLKSSNLYKALKSINQLKQLKRCPFVQLKSNRTPPNQDCKKVLLHNETHLYQFKAK